MKPPAPQLLLAVAFLQIHAARAQEPSGDPATAPIFLDVTLAAGIDFVHQTGASGRRYFPETMGGGVAFLDYDGDGDLDLYFPNGAPLPGYSGPSGLANGLYDNDRGRFTEVEAAAGAEDPGGYGMGCAAADYDNDGRLDLYVTNFGANTMFRNDGPGFADVTAESALGDTAWGAGCAFFDYDNDGDLDLYITNYVHFDFASVDEDLDPYLKSTEKRPRSSSEKISAYPDPGQFPGAEDRLLRNDAGGGFADVTGRSGMVDTVSIEGRGLGVVAVDYDRDGWPDLYVANDGSRNFLYRNLGNGSFRDIAGLAGVAYGLDGQREAGMGVDAGDFDNDGSVDLVVTNFEQEPVSLYRNLGSGTFLHFSYPAGIGLPTLRPLSFGLGFLDYDNDGFLDLFVANGHVLDNITRFDRSRTYGQANQLLHNRGPGSGGAVRFEDVSARAGEGVTAPMVSRGAAFGDYDDDGDTDLLVGNVGQRPNLLRNDLGSGNNWLKVQAAGRRSNRDGIGARVHIAAGDLRLVREVRGSYSYLGQSDLRVSFGLGKQAVVDEVVVDWPSGLRDRITGVKANITLLVVEGGG